MIRNLLESWFVPIVEQQIVMITSLCAHSIMKMPMTIMDLFLKGRPWSFLIYFLKYKNQWVFCITMSPLIILNLDGQIAEGETYIIAFHQVLTEEGNYDVLIGGRYFDEYEKRNDVWKFSSRAVDADWVYVNDPSQVNLTHPMIEGADIGSPNKEDPSYQRLKLFKRGIR